MTELHRYNTEYDKVFAAISGHFLTEQLPNNWPDFDDDYLEEWFTEYALDTYEYWDWTKVFDEVKAITETVMELVNND